MPDGLYERDIVVWADEQAALLRRLAAGERVNASVDWDNVIEELESVGRAQVQACESLVTQALVHLLKQRACPTAPSQSHWRGETVGFLAAARRGYAPSMRHRISVADLYATALKQVREGAQPNEPMVPLPDACPFNIADLVAEPIRIPALVAMLAAPDPGTRMPGAEPDGHA